MENLEYQRENPFSYVERILATPGLQHIAEKIALSLDSSDLDQCQKVSRNFEALITNQRQLHLNRIKTNHKAINKTYWKSRKFYKDRIKEWKVILPIFGQKTSLRDLKIAADFIELYRHKNEFEKSAFEVAVEVENADFLKLVHVEFDVSDTTTVRTLPHGVQQFKAIKLPDFFRKKLDSQVTKD